MIRTPRASKTGGGRRETSPRGRQDRRPVTRAFIHTQALTASPLNFFSLSGRNEGGYTTHGD